MAFVDWNGNGKNDIQDDFIEYQIYQECMKNNNAASGSNHSGGMSTFGAILCTIAGLVLQAILYAILGINAENVPVIVIIILWVFFSALTAVVIEKIGL